MLASPADGELLSSWIIRNSLMQGSDPMGWVYGFWGEWRAWTRDIDRYLPRERAAALSRFSHLELTQIEDMTLAPILQTILGALPDIFRAWPWVIPTGKRNRSVVNGLQFCPECLKENRPILPKRWRLSWHTQCPIHATRLHNQCPQCDLPFSPHLVHYLSPHIYRCNRCGFDLRSVKTIRSNKRLLSFQQTMDRMAQGELLPFQAYPQWSIFSVEEFFAFLRDLLRLPGRMGREEDRYQHWQTWLLGDVRHPKPRSFPGLTFDMRSPEERENLLSIALHLLEHDPAYVAESLRQFKVTSSQLIDRRRSYSSSFWVIANLLGPMPRAHRRRNQLTSVSKEPVPRKEVEKRLEDIRVYLR
jgi:hypothetical protein